MDKREDRRFEVENELNSHGWTNYERFQAIETNGFGILGCSKSHLNVLKIAKERGYKNILILEDDFMFVRSKEEVESELSAFFESEFSVDFDVCMISYNLINGKQMDDFPILTKILDAQTASGYIVNSKYYDTIIELYERTVPLLEETRQHWHFANDQAWKVLQPNGNWFCFTQRFGKQRPGYSDNSECFSDYSV
jgi:glycosyl transferase family 25